MLQSIQFIHKTMIDCHRKCRDNIVQRKLRTSQNNFVEDMTPNLLSADNTGTRLFSKIIIPKRYTIILFLARSVYRVLMYMCHRV